MTREAIALLPIAETADGRERRTGVEIELGGLTEEQIARLAARHLGGEARRLSGDDWEVRGTRIGDLKVYLDIFLRKHADVALAALGLKIGREVIPVEIVTDPLTRDGLMQLSEFIELLRSEGAEGTGRSLLYGFGLHLNPEIASAQDRDIVRPLLAYALIEEWMRAIHPIERTRELLPFTAPFPKRLIGDLARLGPDASLERVIMTYRSHTLSRNHGLDMLPVFIHLRPDLIAPEEGRGGTVSPRPTFHFRLPDCRIDDPDWSLDTEWQRWWLVEAIAARPQLLETLCREWLAEKSGVQILGSRWVARCGALLDEAGLS
ncbi:amidoligase family protein [Thioclava atlantica]|uniref:amidoligase family protein n=1 Tax=Thioclava atlantica TaxID=1317124 RepID=UPI0005710CC7|nr:amidoligase family protein [Thioclava atlantica]